MAGEDRGMLFHCLGAATAKGGPARLGVLKTKRRTLKSTLNKAGVILLQKIGVIWSLQCVGVKNILNHLNIFFSVQNKKNLNVTK